MNDHRRQVVFGGTEPGLPICFALLSHRPPSVVSRMSILWSSRCSFIRPDKTMCCVFCEGEICHASYPWWRTSPDTAYRLMQVPCVVPW